MAIRTERGSSTDKVSGDSLVIPNVTAETGDFLCIVTAGQADTAPSTTKWGLRDCSKAAQRIHLTPTFTCVIWTIRRVLHGGTRNVTITWPVAINTKVAFAFTLDSPFVVDEIAISILTASLAPTVGPTAEHLRRDNFNVGILCAEGGTPDAIPTGITAGWSAGTRVGTAGVPPVSNLTLNQYYQQSATSSGVTLAGTVVDARDWIGLIASFKPAIHSATDTYGSNIEVGDSVRYGGAIYIVNLIAPKRNVVDIGAIGFVNASECEVLN